MIAAVTAAAVVIAIVISVVVVLDHRDGGPSTAQADASRTLLLNTSGWRGALTDPGNLTVEDLTYDDPLTKAADVGRRWRNTDGGFELRQDVQSGASVSRAKDMFRLLDRGPKLREDFGGADPLSTAGAAHADQGVGYCVPRPVGCSSIEYTLRYGASVVVLRLVKANEVKADADGYLRELDDVVSGR